MSFALRHTRYLMAACSCAVMLMTAAPAQATRRWPEAVLATLPPYCRDTELSVNFDMTGARWKYWNARIGEHYHRMHHYCEGLLILREARKHPPRSHARTVSAKVAIKEFDFILARDPSSLRRLPLWPEMLIRRGEAAILIEDWALASESYEQARLVKPDFWPAYLDWADILANLKLQTQARDLIRQGLLIDPTVAPMRNAFVKYGGALKDIPDKPVASAQEPASAVAPAASSASTPMNP